MANPITWQNIQGPRFDDATRALESAQRTFNGSFDLLGNVLKQREATEMGNTQVLQENAKQAYLDQLQGITSPEELEAARMRGDLQQQLSALTPAARAAVRGAEEARLASLRSNATEAWKFQTAKEDQIAAPILNEARALISQNKMDEASALTAGLDPRNKAVLWKELDVRGQEILDRGWKAAEQKRQEGRYNSDMLTAQDNRATNQLSRDVTKFGFDLKKKEETDRAKLTELFNTSLGRFNNTQQQYQMGISSTAKELGIPLNASGLPDDSRMTPAQVIQLNDALKARGLDNAPTSSSAIADLKRQIAGAGIDPRVAAQAEALYSQFSARGRLSAEDAAVEQQQLDAITAAADKAKEQNIFYTPPNKFLELKTNILGKVDQVVKDSPDTRLAIREKMSEWMDTGITIKRGGKSVTVKVPPKVIEAAFAAGVDTDQWFFLGNKTTDKMKTIIEDMMVNPQYDYLRAQAESLTAGEDIQKKKQISANIRSSTGVETPVDALTRQSQLAIEARAEAARQEEKRRMAEARNNPAQMKSGRP